MYSSFTSAYRPEDLKQVERVSVDIPEDFEEWKHIVETVPVIVLYMWSDSCRPCHLVRDKFEAVASILQNENILFFKDNIDKPASIHKNQVDVVPTFFIICDGHEMEHPVHKSRYTGWNASMKDAILFFEGISRRAQERALRQQQPGIICKNNICYIKKD